MLQAQSTKLLPPRKSSSAAILACTVGTGIFGTHISKAQNTHIMVIGKSEHHTGLNIKQKALSDKCLLFHFKALISTLTKVFL